MDRYICKSTWYEQRGDHHMLHICQDFAALLVFICLSCRGRKQRRAGRYRRQLVEITTQEFCRHASPCFLWLHVLSCIKVVPRTPAVSFAQCICMNHRARDATQFIDNIDAGLAHQTVHFLLGLGVESKPRCLQGICHQQAIA